jgi:hypothetical protein
MRSHDRYSGASQAWRGGTRDDDMASRPPEVRMTEPAAPRRTRRAAASACITSHRRSRRSRTSRRRLSCSAKRARWAGGRTGLGHGPSGAPRPHERRKPGDVEFSHCFGRRRPETGSDMPLLRPFGRPAPEAGGLRTARRAKKRAEPFRLRPPPPSPGQRAVAADVARISRAFDALFVTKARLMLFPDIPVGRIASMLTPASARRRAALPSEPGV